MEHAVTQHGTQWHMVVSALPFKNHLRNMRNHSPKGILKLLDPGLPCLLLQRIRVTSTLNFLIVPSQRDTSKQSGQTDG